MGRAARVLLALGLSLPAAIAGAAGEGDFYAGKTINIYIGTGEGPGALTAYPRAIAQVIGRYIPGHPSIVIHNMPGAGGIKAANSSMASRRRTAPPGASSPAASCALRCW